MKLLTTLLLGGGGVALYKLLSLKHAGDELSISTGQIAISKIENVALKMWAEVWYDNFTDVTLHIEQPSVKIFLNDTSTEIGHALPSTEITDVPPHGRNAKAQTIWMAIPLSNIPFAVAALLAGEKANREIIIQIKAQVNGIPYTTESKFTI